MSASQAISPFKFRVEASVSRGNKCPRCWHYHYLQGTPEDLCDRCMRTLLEMKHSMADEINEYYEAERNKYSVRVDK